jgi:hypothetical protein
MNADRIQYLEQLEERFFESHDSSKRTFYFLLYHHTLFMPEDPGQARDWWERTLQRLDLIVRDETARKWFGRYVRRELAKYS